MKKLLKKFRKPLIGFILTVLFAAIVIGAAAVVLNDNKNVSTNDVLSSIEYASIYLAQSVKSDGSFIYEYDPVRDVEEDGYNILRHAGTIYSMFEIYEAFPRQDIRISGERAIEYMNAQMRSCNRNQALCLEEDREVKLGGNALAMLALIQYSEATNTRDHDDTIHKLATWITSVQDEDGQFTIHKASYPSMRRENFVSTYYPGEAIYALARACQLLETESYCADAESAANWIITVRDDGLGINELPHDHWFLYGLRELYTVTNNELYATQSYNIANTIINNQITNDPENPHWVGGFYEPPRSAPTATRMEGLIAAYETGNLSYEYKQDLQKTIKRGVALLTELQITPNILAQNQISFADQGLGGFVRGFGEQDIRIDYVQHAVSALLGYHRHF